MGDTERVSCPGTPRVQFSFIMVVVIKNLPARARNRRDSGVILGWEDPLEKGVTNHSNILAWRIPWTDEPWGLQSLGSLRVGHDWSDLACMRAQHLRWQGKRFTSKKYELYLMSLLIQFSLIFIFAVGFLYSKYFIELLWQWSPMISYFLFLFFLLLYNSKDLFLCLEIQLFEILIKYCDFSLQDYTIV